MATDNTEDEEFIILDEYTACSPDDPDPPPMGDDSEKGGMNVSSRCNGDSKQVKTFFIKVPKVDIKIYGGNVSESRLKTATSHRKASSMAKRKLNQSRRKEKLRALGISSCRRTSNKSTTPYSFLDGFRIPKRGSVEQASISSSDSKVISPKTKQQSNLKQKSNLRKQNEFIQPGINQLKSSLSDSSRKRSTESLVNVNVVVQKKKKVSAVAYKSGSGNNMHLLSTSGGDVQRDGILKYGTDCNSSISNDNRLTSMKHSNKEYPGKQTKVLKQDNSKEKSRSRTSARLKSHSNTTTSTFNKQTKKFSLPDKPAVGTESADTTNSRSSPPLSRKRSSGSETNKTSKKKKFRSSSKDQTSSKVASSTKDGMEGSTFSDCVRESMGLQSKKKSDIIEKSPKNTCIRRKLSRLRKSSNAKVIKDKQSLQFPNKELKRHEDDQNESQFDYRSMLSESIKSLQQELHVDDGVPPLDSDIDSVSTCILSGDPSQSMSDFIYEEDEPSTCTTGLETLLSDDAEDSVHEVMEDEYLIIPDPTSVLEDASSHDETVLLAADQSADSLHGQSEIESTQLCNDTCDIRLPPQLVMDMQTMKPDDNINVKRKKVRIAKDAEIIGIDHICPDSNVPLQLLTPPTRSALKNRHEQPVLKKLSKYDRKKRKKLIRHLKNCKRQEMSSKQKPESLKMKKESRKRKTEKEMLTEIDSVNFPDTLRRERAPSLKAIEAVMSNRVMEATATRKRQRKQNITLLEPQMEESSVSKKRRTVEKTNDPEVKGKVVPKKGVRAGRKAANKAEIKVYKKGQSQKKKNNKKQKIKIFRSQGCQTPESGMDCRVRHRSTQFYKEASRGPVPMQSCSVQVDKSSLSLYLPTTTPIQGTCAVKEESNEQIWLIRYPVGSCSRCVPLSIVIGRLLKPLSTGTECCVEPKSVPQGLVKHFEALFRLLSKLQHLDFHRHPSMHHVNCLIIALKNLKARALHVLSILDKEFKDIHMVVDNVDPPVWSLGTSFYTLGSLLIKIHNSLMNIRSLLPIVAGFRDLRNCVETCLLLTFYLRVYIGDNYTIPQVLLDSVKANKAAVVRVLIDPHTYVLDDTVPSFSDLFDQCSDRLVEAANSVNAATEAQFEVYKEFMTSLSKQCQYIAEYRDQHQANDGDHSARTDFNYKEMDKYKDFITERALLAIEAKKSFIRTAVSLDMSGIMPTDVTDASGVSSSQANSTKVSVSFSGKEKQAMRLVHKLIASKLSSMINRYTLMGKKSKISANKMQEMVSILFQHFFRRIQTLILRSNRNRSLFSCSFQPSISGQVDFSTQMNSSLTDISKMISTARQCIHRLNHQKGAVSKTLSAGTDTVVESEPSITQMLDSVQNILQQPPKSSSSSQSTCSADNTTDEPTAITQPSRPSPPLISHPSPLMDLIMQHRAASAPKPPNRVQCVSQHNPATQVPPSTVVTSNTRIAVAKVPLAPSTEPQHITVPVTPITTVVIARPAQAISTSISTSLPVTSRISPGAITSSTVSPLIMVPPSPPPPASLNIAKISNLPSITPSLSVTAIPVTSGVFANSLRSCATTPPGFSFPLPSISQFLNRLNFLTPPGFSQSTTSSVVSISSNTSTSNTPTTSHVAPSTSKGTVITTTHDVATTTCVTKWYNAMTRSDVTMTSSDVTTSTKSNVFMTKNDVNMTKSDVIMRTTKINVITTKGNVTTTKGDVKNKSDVIVTTKSDVTTTKGDVTTTKKDVTATKSDVTTGGVMSPILNASYSTMFLGSRNPSKAVYVQALTRSQPQSSGPSCKPTTNSTTQSHMLRPRGVPNNFNHRPSMLRTATDGRQMMMPTATPITSHVITTRTHTCTTNTNTIVESRMTATPQEIFSTLTYQVLQHLSPAITLPTTTFTNPIASLEGSSRKANMGHIFSLLSNVYSNLSLLPGAVPSPMMRGGTANPRPPFNYCPSLPLTAASLPSIVHPLRFPTFASSSIPTPSIPVQTTSTLMHGAPFPRGLSSASMVRTSSIPSTRPAARVVLSAVSRGPPPLLRCVVASSTSVPLTKAPTPRSAPPQSVRPLSKLPAMSSSVACSSTPSLQHPSTSSNPASGKRPTDIVNGIPYEYQTTVESLRKNSNNRQTISTSSGRTIDQSVNSSKVKLPQQPTLLSSKSSCNSNRVNSQKTSPKNSITCSSNRATPVSVQEMVSASSKDATFIATSSINNTTRSCSGNMQQTVFCSATSTAQQVDNIAVSMANSTTTAHSNVTTSVSSPIAVTPAHNDDCSINVLVSNPPHAATSCNNTIRTPPLLISCHTPSTSVRSSSPTADSNNMAAVHNEKDTLDDTMSPADLACIEALLEYTSEDEVLPSPILNSPALAELDNAIDDCIMKMNSSTSHTAEPNMSSQENVQPKLKSTAVLCYADEDNQVTTTVHVPISSYHVPSSSCHLPSTTGHVQSSKNVNVQPSSSVSVTSSSYPHVLISSCRVSISCNVNVPSSSCNLPSSTTSHAQSSKNVNVQPLSTVESSNVSSSVHVMSSSCHLPSSSVSMSSPSSYVPKSKVQASSLPDVSSFVATSSCHHVVMSKSSDVHVPLTMVNCPSASSPQATLSGANTDAAHDDVGTCSNHPSSVPSAKLTLDATVIDSALVLQWNLKPVDASIEQYIESFEICYAKIPDRSHFTFEGCCNASWSSMGNIQRLILPMSATLVNLHMNQCYLFIIKGVLSSNASAIYSDIKFVLIS